MRFIHYSNFKDVFSCFDRVIVTGPQRSGTKIVANIISIDTGFDLIRHTKIPGTEGLEKFKSASRIVLHNPSFVAFLEDIEDDSTAIVYCWRNLDDIHLSEKKWDLDEDDGLLREQVIIAWKGYCDMPKTYEDINPAKTKNALWESVLEEKLKNTFTVKYEKLKGHRLWVSKEERAKFKNVNQVSVSGDIYRISK